MFNIFTLLLDHPDHIHPFKCHRPDLARHLHGDFIAGAQEVDQLAPLELDHQVGDPVLVVVADAVGSGLGRDAAFEADGRDVDICQFVPLGQLDVDHHPGSVACPVQGIGIEVHRGNDAGLRNVDGEGRHVHPGAVAVAVVGPGPPLVGRVVGKGGAGSPGGDAGTIRSYTGAGVYQRATRINFELVGQAVAVGVRGVGDCQHRRGAHYAGSFRG